MKRSCVEGEEGNFPGNHDKVLTIAKEELLYMGPLVSVVIPTYNRAYSVGKAVHSVIRQTYENLEIIIVDDGSTDNTREIIENIKDSRIVYIYQKNQRQSAARNNGVRVAKGDLIAFLDSDDIWLPEKLEKQVKAFQSDPHIGLVTCWSKSVNVNDPDNYAINACYARNREEFILDLLLEKVIISTSQAVIKRECFEKLGGFDPNFLLEEDYDMFLRVASEDDVFCINEVLAIYYKKSGQSLCDKTAVEEIKADKELLFRKAFNNPKLPESIMRDKKRIYGALYFHSGVNSVLFSHDSVLARKYFLEGLRLHLLGFFKLKIVSAAMLSLLPASVGPALINLIRKAVILTKKAVGRKDYGF